MTTKYTKSQIVWSNALVWVFLYLLPFILWRGEVVNWGRMAYVHAVILAGCAFVFYFNYFYLTERLLFRKRTGMFFLANTGTALACAACMLLLQRLWPGQAADDTATYITSYASHVVLLAILSGISIIAKTIVKWNDTENRRQVEERRRKEEEERKKSETARQQLEMGSLFNAQAAVQGYQPKMKVSKKIELLNTEGILPIISMWWRLEGCKLSVEELSKMFKKQITFCEKVANKDGEFIEDESVNYIDDIKAK